MGKSKRKLNDLSILSTFVLLAVVFLLLAMLLVEVERTLLTNAQRDIAFQYSDVVEGFNSEKVWGNQSVYLLSEHDGRMMWLYEMGMWTLPPFTYLACFILAGFVFYRSKIRRPLMFLTTSANRIAENDLDFSIVYDRNDEMGLLCKAFEKMRSALESNNREMWRQMNERQKLNAAFSHDLRTPLTVMEGHLGILQKYTPQGKLSADDVMQTYAAMAGQIERLKNYTSSTYEHPMTESRIEEIAEESNTVITSIKHIDCLLLGVQNNYKNGERDWGSRIVVSEDNFNVLSGATISVPKGSYTVYYDSSMEYKLNAFSAESSLFYNPTTEQEFYFIQNEPICYDGLFNTRSVFSSFLILNNEDYRTIAATLADEYRAVSYMVNVENWQDTIDFQNNILKAVISDNNGVIFTNWHNSATFEKTGSQAEYLPFDGNETKIARLWSLYPLSKLSSTTTQFEAFATYLMLMLFIAIVAFVSAVMVIGLKLISTIWDDAEVYNDLRRLGMKRKKIKGLITKQMLFVYFIPTVLGCIIGAFTTYRIMLVSGVIYIGETMQLVGCVCGLVLIIQIAIFFILRSRIMRSYT